MKRKSTFTFNSDDVLSLQILETDTRPNPAIDYTPFEEPACRVFPKSAANNRYVEMPAVVTNLLYENKGMTWLFIREAVSACREVSGTCEFGAKIIVDMLVQISYCSSSFSQLLMDELMNISAMIETSKPMI